MRFNLTSKAMSILLLSLISSVVMAETQTQKTIPIKMVVVTMFEDGKPTGDNPGELQTWVEKGGYNKQIKFPLGKYLFTNDKGVLVICTGVGIANATASIMALGLDPRFDLSKAYWMVAGIAGGDPADVSLGSAVWATHVIDGDLAYEIDAREMPKDWPYALVPFGAKKPTTDPAVLKHSWGPDTIAYTLDSKLAKWAFNNTKDIKLKDSPGIQKFRSYFKSFPNALKPPFVTMGDTLSSDRYWHGKHMNKWANDWVKLYGGPSANFMTTQMEDNGTLTALMRLARVHKVDSKRIMVLRTVSNYTMAPANESTSWSLKAPYPDNGLPAKEAAYIVGSKIVDLIENNWNTYKTTLPYETR